MDRHFFQSAAKLLAALIFCALSFNGSNEPKCRRTLAGEGRSRAALPSPSFPAGLENETPAGANPALEIARRLPPRPKVPEVEILSREDRGEYTLEKFSLTTVPAQSCRAIFSCEKPFRKSAAILFCHRHGGLYDLGKEELFETNRAPESRAGPSRARLRRPGH